VVEKLAADAPIDETRKVNGRGGEGSIDSKGNTIEAEASNIKRSKRLRAYVSRHLSAFVAFLK
jgi:hypothetical protein